MSVKVFKCSTCGHPVDQQGNWFDIKRLQNLGIELKDLKAIKVRGCEHESLFIDPIHFVPKGEREQYLKEKEDERRDREAACAVETD